MGSSDILGCGRGPARQLGSVRVGTESLKRDPTYTGFGWRPRSIDDTVDAGVHPVIAAMRLGQKQTVAASVHIVDGIDLKAQPWEKGKKVYEHGYTYNRKNGPASGAGSLTDPTAQIDRLVGHGVNTQDYMKQAKKLGMNPVAAVLRQESGPGLPDGSGEQKSKKKKDKKKDKKKKHEKK